MKSENKQQHIEKILDKIEFIPEVDSKFQEREYNLHHTSYLYQKKLYEYVKQGDIAGYHKWCDDLKTGKIPFVIGKVSNDPLRQYQYLFVTFISVITRAAIEGGLLEMDAFTYSDEFVREIDHAKSLKECTNAFHIIEKMIMDIRKLSIKTTTNLLVIRCKNYIHDNLHGVIKRDDLADKLGISPQYLSTLFKSETGVTISDYITKQKITTSMQMLKTADMNISDIAFVLGFSSQSHFTFCFKKITGTTPKKYKDNLV